MRTTWRWLGALVALIATFGAPAASAEAAKAPRGFYGVSTQTPLDGADWRALGRGRVGSLRIELSWGGVDLLPPASSEELFTPRPYRWSIVDPTVRKAARRGIRILPAIYGTPHWVAQYQGCYTQCHKLGPTTIQAQVAFAMFMRAAVLRYGPGGSFWAAHPNLPHRPIRAWQIWNEQNSSDFWKPQPDVGAYTNLLIAGGTAVHDADPGAQVVLGGMFGEPKEEGKITMAGWDFLDAINANPRARTAFDGIAIHPYGHTLHQVKATIQRWRRALRGADALDEEIWITEIGWASGGERHPLNVGIRGQAELLDGALAYFTRHRKRYHLAQVNVYSWRDAAPGADNCSWCVKSGLVRYKGRRPKPSWDVFRGYTGALPPR
jgi:hypothetical protein